MPTDEPDPDPCANDAVGPRVIGGWLVTSSSSESSVSSVDAFSGEDDEPSCESADPDVDFSCDCAESDAEVAVGVLATGGGLVSSAVLSSLVLSVLVGVGVVVLDTDSLEPELEDEDDEEVEDEVGDDVVVGA